MNKSIRIIPLLFFIPLSAQAVNPIGYGGWTSTTGTIDTTASCASAGNQCKTLVSDNGFLLEEVKTPTYTYQRLLLTDPSSSGDMTNLGFATETIIPFALAGQGIDQGMATKQVVRDPVEKFEMTAEIQKGNLRSNGATPQDMYTSIITQSIGDQASDMTSSFAVKTYTTWSGFQDYGTKKGRVLDMDQTVDTDKANGKKQQMVHRVREGTAGIWWPNPPLTNAGTVNLGGVDVTWNSGDEVRSTWIATHDLSGLANPVAMTKQVFTVNESSASPITAEDMMLDVVEPVNPFVWTADLGPTPVFP